MTELDDLAGLLSQTAEAHHRAFIATNGFDPNWASWYAGYLLDNGFGQFVNIAHASMVDLAALLIAADRQHQAEVSPPAWEPYYAKLLLAAFRSEGRTTTTS